MDAEQPAPYQSLYRRFRPQRFAEVRGQPHVTTALANAVRDGRVSHAYLFSGPRGTGKTSTARILAKALNCEAPADGEPCGVCASCVAVQRGASLDVHELDAASNNGVDAMRDLVSRAALATPGRSKVYIVDEVHMLSSAAANTLLKTLEEPPAHVTFVLATTDDQKVLPTIRSRTQHFEFRLLPADDLAALVAEVNAAAGLGLASPTLDQVARRGRGSARDALSALDQAAAAGPDAPLDDGADGGRDLVAGLCERDAGRCLRAVAAACAAGRDPRRVATELLEELRELLLATTAPELADGDAAEEARRADQAAQLGPAGLVRAMEALGQAVIDMREALEPRVTLEVAVVRVAQPDVDVSRAAVLERLERLERRVAALGGAGVEAPPAGEAPPSADAATAAARSAPPPREGPAAGPRAALGALRSRTEPRAADVRAPTAGPPPGPAQPASPPAEAAPSGPASTPAPPSRDELTKAWGDGVLASLPGRAKSRYASGRFVAVEGGAAVFAIPNEHWLARCREVQPDVEAALAARFGRPVPLRLVLDDQSPGPVVPGTPGGEPTDEPADEPVPWDGPAPALASPEERLKQAFPGAEEVG